MSGYLWHPTPILRWVVKEVEVTDINKRSTPSLISGKYDIKEVTVLQQQWVNNIYEYEWRDIPIETET